MESYHNSPNESMKIFPSQRIARINRRPGQITIPFGAPGGSQRWTNIPEGDYIKARYSVRFA